MSQQSAGPSEACEKCGSLGPDPFALEVNGDDTERLLCEECRQAKREV